MRTTFSGLRRRDVILLSFISIPTCVGLTKKGTVKVTKTENLRLVDGSIMEKRLC